MIFEFKAMICISKSKSCHLCIESTYIHKLTLEKTAMQRKHKLTLATTAKKTEKKHKLTLEKTALQRKHKLTLATTAKKTEKT